MSNVQPTMARIQNRYDTEANWNKTDEDGKWGNYVAKQGELIIYDMGSGKAPKLKVGDGKSKVYELKFVETAKQQDTLIKKPELVIDSFAYTGGLLSPVFKDLDRYNTILSGSVSAVNVGNYNITISLPDNCMWEDKSTDTLQFNWYITQQTIQPIVKNVELFYNNTYELSDTYIDPKYKSEITFTYDKELINKVDLNVNGNLVITTAADKILTEETNVTISCSTGNYTISNGTFKIKLSNYLDQSTMSWSRLSQLAKDGTLRNYLEIGDVKQIELNGTVTPTDPELEFKKEIFYAYVIHVDPKYVLFQLGKKLNSENKLVSVGIDGLHVKDDTTTIGWSGSMIRSTLGSIKAVNPDSNTLISCLPEELRNNMSSISLYSDNYGKGKDSSDSVTITWDYLPLLSVYEYGFDSPDYANTFEHERQSRPKYYELGNNTNKVYKHNNLTSLASCWTRTLSYYESGNLKYWYAFTSGANSNQIGSSHASEFKCVSPIFRIS